MSILDSIKDDLEKHASLKVNQFGEYTSYELKVMVALFVLQAAYADGVAHPDERMEILKILTGQFDFSDEQAAQVIEVAEFLISKEKKMEEFAEQICKQFKESQRVRLLAMYVRVIEADGVVTVDEAKGVDRVLELLQLTEESIYQARRELDGEQKSGEED